MRVSISRITWIFLYVAIVLAAIAYPACALSLPETPGLPQMVYPMNMFYKGQASIAQSGNAATASPGPDFSFFNSALGMIPTSDANTAGQINGILQMQQYYQPQYTTPQSSSYSWMSPFTQPSAIQEESNPALSSYNYFLKYNPGMKNIFA